MLSATLLLRILALILVVCSIILLHTAWRLKTRNWIYVIAGWILFISSIVAWSYTSGSDKGAALGIVCNVLIAVIFITIIAMQSPPRVEKPTRAKPIKQKHTSKLDYIKRFYVGLLIGPIAGVTALGIATAAFQSLRIAGAEHTANLTLVSLSFPVLWAGISVLAVYQTLLWRKTAAVVSPGLLSLIYILLTA